MHQKHNILRYVKSDPKAQKEVGRLRVMLTDLHKTGRLVDPLPQTILNRAMELIRYVTLTYRLDFKGSRQAAQMLIETLRTEINS